MNNALLVGFGGFLGAVMRYAAGGLVVRIGGGVAAPVATLVVNLAGCLLIGTLASWLDARGIMETGIRLFLAVGLLGGFTTYSAFGLETLNMLRGTGGWGIASAYVAIHVIGGVAAVGAGIMAGRVIAGV